MDDKSIKREARRQRAFERLGTNSPRCVRCGEDDPLCLENHHIAKRLFDDLTTILCRNCHRKVSDLEKDRPPWQKEQEFPQTEIIGRFLLGLADLFELLIQKLREFGEALIGKRHECQSDTTRKVSP